MQPTDPPSNKALTIAEYDEALAIARENDELEKFLVTYLRREIRERAVGDKRLEDILTSTMVEVQEQLNNMRDSMTVISRLETDQLQMKRSLDAYVDAVRLLLKEQARESLTNKLHADGLNSKIDLLSAAVEKVSEKIDSNERKDARQDKELKKIESKVTVLSAVKAGVAGGSIIAVWEALKHIF